MTPSRCSRLGADELDQYGKGASEKTDHPCQFPVALVQRLVLSMTNEGDIVLDPFMGVDTTERVTGNSGSELPFSVSGATV